MVSYHFSVRVSKNDLRGTLVTEFSMLELLVEDIRLLLGVINHHLQYLYILHCLHHRQLLYCSML